MPVPEGVRPQAIRGEFATAVEPVLRSLSEQQVDTDRPVPSFFMLDPFGIKGVPFEFFQDQLALAKSECLFTFMWEAIERHSQTPEFAPHMRELMGDDRWVGLSALGLKEYVYARFGDRLREAGAKYVLVFDLWNGGNHVYSLFFATRNLKGCDVMKQSIWEVDPTGSYSFRGVYPGQMTMNMASEPQGLEYDLRQEFGHEWVTVEQAEEFVQSDKTRFHSGHLRSQTLRPLEKAGVIVVDRPNGAKQFSSGKEIRFRFIEQKEAALLDKQGALF